MRHSNPSFRNFCICFVIALLDTPIISARESYVQWGSSSNISNIFRELFRELISDLRQIVNINHPPSSTTSGTGNPPYQAPSFAIWVRSTIKPQNFSTSSAYRLPPRLAANPLPLAFKNQPLKPRHLLFSANKIHEQNYTKNYNTLFHNNHKLWDLRHHTFLSKKKTRHDQNQDKQMPLLGFYTDEPSHHLAFVAPNQNKYYRGACKTSCMGGAASPLPTIRRRAGNEDVAPPWFCKCLSRLWCGRNPIYCRNCAI